MYGFEIVKLFGSHVIKANDDFHSYPLYVSKVYKGNYSWTTDYLYGKRFSMKTAQKHLKILKGE